MQIQEKSTELEKWLPAGFNARAAAMSDLEEIVALFNAAGEKLIGNSSKFTTARYQSSWTAPGFNIETDTDCYHSRRQNRRILSEVNDHEPHVTLQCWAWYPAYEKQEGWANLPAELGRSARDRPSSRTRRCTYHYGVLCYQPEYGGGKIVRGLWHVIDSA
ncbi:MAG: hypothetical protein U0694_21910 [Anaerolineae bacterium]